MGIFGALENKLTVNVIKNKLEKLEGLDTSYRIFGSNKHKYKTNPTLSDEQIRVFEDTHSLKIPAEYRLYLQNIGDSGAGPFYGLYELENNDGISPDLTKKFEYTRQNPFNLMKVIDEQFPQEVNDDNYGEYSKLLDGYFHQVCRGLIILAHEGCGTYSTLIVKGEEYGNVWYFDFANDAGAFPLTNPTTGKPMRFLEWYEIWLDSSIDYLKTGKKPFMSYADFIAKT